MMCRDFQIFFIELKITIKALVSVADGYCHFPEFSFMLKRKSKKKFCCWLLERKVVDLILAKDKLITRSFFVEISSI